MNYAIRATSAATIRTNNDEDIVYESPAADLCFEVLEETEPEAVAVTPAPVLPLEELVSNDCHLIALSIFRILCDNSKNTLCTF